VPIPLIPVIIGGAAILGSVLGLKKGAKGVSDIKNAKRIAARVHTNGKIAVENLNAKRSDVNRAAESYGDLLIKIRRDTFGRFVRFVEALGQRGSLEAMEALEEVNVAAPQIREYKIAAIEAHRVASGSAAMIGASTGASAGTTGLIGLLGTASTGTAISGLTGAAAANATLAWLGGGAVAAGGGGMAVGTLVLGGVTVAPAVLVGGFVLAGRGAKALTEAKAYEAKVGAEVAKIDAVRDFMGRVIIRIHEMETLVRKLDTRVNLTLDQLDPTAFEIHNETDVKAFQQAGLLMKAMAEVMKTPVLDGNGNITGQSLAIQTKYRTLAG
jgi:hypothetical protein